MFDWVKTFLRGSFRLMSSYTLACVLFLLLLAITYLGTLAQVEHGLYAAQQQYFESFFVVHWIHGLVPLPLPGGYLLLCLLFVNTLCGGILRARKGWTKVGSIIMHAGMLLLLFGGFIAYQFGVSGHLTLYEGEQSDVFKSHYDWELAVTRRTPDGEAIEYVFAQEVFEGLRPGSARVLAWEGWPFELMLADYAPNVLPRPAGPAAAPSARVVDGVYLAPQPVERELERNTAGLYAQVQELGGATQDLLLWGLQQAPARVEIEGETWTFDLRRRQWTLPFAIRLDTFTRELHPGTNMPAAFMSDVTKFHKGMEQKVRISMNAPLRHEGYTLYQASWGPQDARPGDPLFSSFAVVRNPADQFPLYACIIITLGMFVHFGIYLWRYLAAETTRRQQP